MTQTPDERVRLLEAGKDGCILCLDLSHADGQMGAEMLARNYPAVAEALRSRTGNMQYLLALLPAEHIEGVQPVVLLVDPAALPEAVTNIHTRSKNFGAISIVVAPKSSRIADLFHMLDTAATVSAS
jgi:hypothetical protein